MRISVIKQIEEMNIGEEIEFPITMLATIRNYVSGLNTRHFLAHRHWASESERETGLVRVRRNK